LKFVSCKNQSNMPIPSFKNQTLSKRNVFPLDYNIDHCGKLRIQQQVPEIILLQILSSEDIAILDSINQVIEDIDGIQNRKAQPLHSTWNDQLDALSRNDANKKPPSKGNKQTLNKVSSVSLLEKEIRLTRSSRSKSNHTNATLEIISLQLNNSFKSLAYNLNSFCRKRHSIVQAAPITSKCELQASDCFNHEYLLYLYTTELFYQAFHRVRSLRLNSARSTECLSSKDLQPQHAAIYSSSFCPAATSPSVSVLLCRSESNSPTSPMYSPDGAQEGKMKRFKIPRSVRQTLMRWLDDHWTHPYPTDDQKAKLCTETGLNLSQLNNWFVNTRVRKWKPQVGPNASKMQKKGAVAAPNSASMLNDWGTKLKKTSAPTSLPPMPVMAKDWDDVLRDCAGFNAQDVTDLDFISAA